MQAQSIRGIVLQAARVLPLGEYKVGIFGSRATGRAAKWSDLDLAVWGKERVPGDKLEAFKEKLENSDLPYFVDVVDINYVSLVLKQRVLQEVQWL